MSRRPPPRPKRDPPLARLEARIPPPVLAVIAALVIYGLHREWPVARLWTGERPALAAICALMIGAAGIALAGESLSRFIRRRTWFHPVHPERATTLVMDGAYRWTRNPMYLGLLLVLTGWAVWLGSASPFAVLPWFVVVLDRLQIEPEERALLDRFGGEYAQYRDEVRRWIGRR
jgi:protein-S-isoprenylcysteine O-methyltransferase Ste14